MSIIVLFFMMVTNVLIATIYDVVAQSHYFSVLFKSHRSTVMGIKFNKNAPDVPEEDYKLRRNWCSRSYDHDLKNWLVKVYHFDNIDTSDVANLIPLEKMNLFELHLDCLSVNIHVYENRQTRKSMKTMHVYNHPDVCVQFFSCIYTIVMRYLIKSPKGVA